MRSRPRARRRAVLLTLLRGRRARGLGQVTPTDLVSDADVAAERADPRASSPRGGPTTRSWGRRAATSPARRSALGRRPARRDRQLPLPHPAVGVSRRVRGRRAVARRARPAARRAVDRAARGGRRCSTACRCAGRARDELATAMVATGFGYDADVRAAQAGSSPGCCRSVRDIRRLGSRRSTSPGWRPGATTPTTSTASTPGTGRPGRCCAARRPRDAPPGGAAGHRRGAPGRAAGDRRRARGDRHRMTAPEPRPTARRPGASPAV